MNLHFSIIAMDVIVRALKNKWDGKRFPSHFFNQFYPTFPTEILCRKVNP